MEATAKLVIFFAVTGAIAGCISGIISGANVTLGLLALLLALFLFYVSYKLVTHHKFKNVVLKISNGGIPGGTKKIIMTGFLPHFIMWLIVWVMVYTLLVVK